VNFAFLRRIFNFFRQALLATRDVSELLARFLRPAVKSVASRGRISLQVRTVFLPYALNVLENHHLDLGSRDLVYWQTQIQVFDVLGRRGTTLEDFTIADQRQTEDV